MTFWIILALVPLLVAATLLRPLLRRAEPAPHQDVNLAVYRDQLAEVDRDLDRGVLGPEAAERARTEIARRILAADKARVDRTAAPGGRGLAWVAGIAVVLLVVAGSVGLYMQLGAPGYGDLPLQARIEASARMASERPGQSTAEAEAAAAMPFIPPPDPEHAALVERLRRAVAERPGDERGLRLLARNEASLGNFSAAHIAQAQLLELLGENAGAADFADYGDLLILAAGGYVSPEAEAALDAALLRDPSNGAALYYTGLKYAQVGRPDLSFEIWRDLLARSGPEAPWREPIEVQIAEVAARAGVRFEPSDAGAAPMGRGPSAEDVAAAAEMSPEERMEMIRGMVSGLSDRLAAEGGPPEDWARLIGALGVLGDTGQAEKIWAEAQSVFSGNETALAMIDAAANRAGLTR